jgi:hypothetical protein
MARPRRSPVLGTPPAVTTERATRLCRLLRLVGTRGQSRATLLSRLRLDIRGFYRDLKLLREVGIAVELQKSKYVLEGDAEEAILRLPFPDPHLTLGEAAILGKGRTAIHQKIKHLLQEILPK